MATLGTVEVTGFEGRRALLELRGGASRTCGPRGHDRRAGPGAGRPVNALPRALGSVAVVLAAFAIFLVAFLVAPLAVLAVFVLGLAAAERARRT